MPFHNGLVEVVSFDCFDWSPLTAPGNQRILLCADCCGRRAGMYSVTAAEFTVPWIANIFMSYYISLWDRSVKWLSDNGLHLCSELSRKVHGLMGVQRLAPN